MPCFETPVTNRQLLCGCVIAKPEDIQSENIDLQHLRHYTALIDTGASGCSISKRVVDDLGLVCSQTADIVGVHGAKETKIYEVSMGLFTTSKIHEKDSQGADQIQHNIKAKIASSVIVFEFDSIKQDFDAIIGMEYLSICTLVVSHNKFTLCY